MAKKSISEEKLDQILEGITRLEEIVIGDSANSRPGLCSRIARIERTQQIITLAVLGLTLVFGVTISSEHGIIIAKQLAHMLFVSL